MNGIQCETIGDVYMVASGLPVRYAEHASELTTMALHLLSVISSFKIPHMPNEMLQLRIGIHSGQFEIINVTLCEVKKSKLRNSNLLIVLLFVIENINWNLMVQVERMYLELFFLSFFLSF